MWILLLCFLALYYAITRGIPRVLSWFIVFRYKVQISIGRISILRLSFEDVLIKKATLSIKIEQIGFTSSLFNQEERKLLAVQFFDVRIEKENDTLSNISKDKDDYGQSIHEIFEAASNMDTNPEENIRFLQKRIPPSIISLAQFFGIHIMNINLMYLREKWPECLVHGSAEKLIIEGATVTDCNVAANINLSDAHIRLLQPQHRLGETSLGNQKETTHKVDINADTKATIVKKALNMDPSLVELMFSLKVYVEMKSETHAEMEVVSVQLISPEIIIQERFLTFLENKALVASPIEGQLNKPKLSLKQKLTRYWFFLPIKAKFGCTGLDVKFRSSVGKTAGRGCLSTINLKTNFSRNTTLVGDIRGALPAVNIIFEIHEAQLFGLHDSFVSLLKYTIDAQGSDLSLSLRTELHSLHALYDHRDVQVWSTYIARWTRSKARNIKPQTMRLQPSKNSSIFSLGDYNIKLDIEVFDVGVAVSVPCYSEVPNSTISNAQLFVMHARHHLNLEKGLSQIPSEILIESFLMKLGSDDIISSGFPASAASKKWHKFGTCGSLGLCLVHVSSNAGLREDTSYHLDTLFDNVQLEWSTQFAQFIKNMLSYIEHTKTTLKTFPKPKRGAVPPAEIDKIPISISGRVTAVNIFCHTDHNVSVMTRVDTIEFSKTLESTKAVFEGSKFICFSPNGKTFSCIKAADIKDEWCDIKALTAEYVSSEVHLDIAEKLQLNWSTPLHMTLLTLVRDISAFVQSNRGAKENVRLREDPKSSLALQLTAKGDIQLGAELSSRHRIDFVSGDAIFLMARERMSFQTKDLEVLFDKYEVFHLIESKLVKTLNSVEVKEERESFPELNLDQNKAWKLSVDTWRTTFPYNYNFAEAFTENLLSIVKWLKLVHNHKKKPFTSESPLPPDIVIKVREFTVEICDDPFEVKLRYNYELMEDEYQESCKRRKALDQRIEETRKTNLQLLSGKIDSLNKALLEKNSEIYIKRSKKMYEKPMRTQLFLCRMEDVFLYALADPSYHGTGAVISHMKDIDAHSPWPEEGLEFTTLWCRMLSASCGTWKFHLRDYPQPLWDVRDTEIWGRLIGAEQKPTKRATRSVPIEIGTPWSYSEVQRSLTSLKFYHDLNWEASSLVAAYGPCWEPAVSQFNLALSLINRPSRDPSFPLPWWDKARLLLHGRLTLVSERTTLLLHASLDPYNTTEEMELTWHGLNLDWTNANLHFSGDLNVYVRTASKYDDVRLLHLPNLKISVKLNWVCKGNFNDHHAVMPCAPDKLPEYSSNQEHDSYRVFRSQKLKMNLGLETRQKKSDPSVSPIEILSYGSTLRWFENLKFILSGVTRPTRRGRLFNNTLPRKPQLSRHYQSVHLSISFQRFDIRYWMSVRVQKGFHLSGERLSLSSEHSLTLIPPKENGDLQRRLQSNWSIVYLNTELCHAQIWLQSVMMDTSEMDGQIGTSSDTPTPSITSPVEKFYFMNLSKVAYMRETLEPNFPCLDDCMKDTPAHRLVVHNLKGVWTTSNRDIVFTLFDSWMRNQEMKQNLSPDIIKSFTPGTSTPQKPRMWQSDSGGPLSPNSLLQVPNPAQNTPSPRSRLQSDHTTAMLQQLIAEKDNNFIAYAEDCSNPEPRDQTLQGIKAACTTDDVIHKTWLIQLVNSQVLLKGCETQGYVIISAAQSQISQRIHRPTWRDHSLMAKTTWSGSLDCMQYYATVSEGSQDAEMDIMWLTLDNIEEKENTVINEVTDIVGSGQSVGGVVSQIVGGTSTQENESVQLQRIVSRCRCEFFYVSYGEIGIDPSLLEEAPPPSEEELWNSPVEAADTFTLMHYDICASTNHLQYNMVVDILNNLLLYIDPRKKEASGALARMRFKLQLYSSEDQRKPVVSLQNQVRYHLSQLRFLEKEVYLLQRRIDKEPTEELFKQRTQLEAQVSECKEKVTGLSDELAIRIHCYNETQLSANKKLSASQGDDKKQSLIRMNEVYFRKAQWRLTEADGQLSIAQLDLSNFLYSKKTFSNDIGEHLLEVGFIHMSNRLPNQPYKDVLTPAELRSSMPVDRQKTLRIYCREKPPCGGISIIEHFEINVVPMKIALTYQFFKKMMQFCFPYNSTDDDVDVNSGGKKGDKQSAHKKTSKVSSFYVNLHKDEVEIMKQRAEQNKHFVFIKIPELPVEVSYKGKKDKNIEDVDKSRLVVPTMEYHSVTWTWLDLLLAIKQTAKSALLPQAIKHKLIPHLRSHDESTPSEEDKARLLLGTKHLPPVSKGSKKSLFKFTR